MTPELHYLIAPVIGGIIGYITNDIAIRMLFRPHRPKFILGHKLPFTPGLIPKEKGRIASAVGDAISTNLINKDTLEKNLLSDDMLSKIDDMIDKFIDKQKNNNETLRQFLSHYICDNEIDKISDTIKNMITEQTERHLSDSLIGSQIADAVVEQAAEKMANADIAGIKIPQIILKPIVGTFINYIKSPAKSFLSNNIDQLVHDKGPAIVSNIVDHGKDELMETKICDILKGKEEQIDDAKQTLKNLYITLVRDNLPKALAAIDIHKVVENRINEMDIVETEKLILQVMNKELRAIVWLGALLGTIMGCINIFI